MTKVVLGWGSLLWDPAELAAHIGVWEAGGPALPLEFSRVSSSRKGALTLVVDTTNGVDCPTWFASSTRGDLEDVIGDLRCRQGTTNRRIGFVDCASGRRHPDSDPAVLSRVEAWLDVMGFEAAVWTALESNFRHQIKRAFSVETAREYLRSLKGEAARLAREYVRAAPPELETPLRTVLDGAPWWPHFGVMPKLSRSDLLPWVVEAVRARGGEAHHKQVAREVWKAHADEIQADDDFFFVWQYELRWAGRELRKRRILKPASESRRGVWVLAQQSGGGVLGTGVDATVNVSVGSASA